MRQNDGYAALLFMIEIVRDRYVFSCSFFKHEKNSSSAFSTATIALRICFLPNAVNCTSIARVSVDEGFLDTKPACSYFRMDFETVILSIFVCST